jgi:hypothetical protein
MIQAHYREDYPGEFIVIETRWSGGKKHQSREWVPNPIENQHISGRAACIGSDVDQEKFDYTKLQRHRGGLLSSKKLQTYGAGHVAKQMRLDFAVESDVTNLEELMNLNYHDKNIIYTTTKNCLKYPENFYIVPHRPRSIDPVLAVYLAAFDQHKEIFLLGYNKEVFVDSPDWQQQLDQIFSAYSGVSFFIVGERTNMFPQWFEHANVNHLDHRQFVIYCDV